MARKSSTFFEDVRERQLQKTLSHFLGLIAITYAILDVPRRFMGGSPVILLLVDAIVLTLYFYYLSLFGVKKGWLDGIRFMPFEFKVFFVGLAILVFYSLINPVYQSLLLNAMAIRTYLLPIPMVLIGYHFFRSWSDPSLVSRVEKFLATLGILAATLAFLQFGLNWLGIKFLTPLEHEYHSFYHFEIEMISSTFASAKKFSRFMVFIMILYWLTRIEQNKPFGLVGLYLLGSIFVSGSREGLVIAVLFLVLASGFNFARMKRSPLRLPRLSPSVKFLMLIPLLIVIVAILSHFSTRVQYFLAADDPLNFLIRIIQFFPLFGIDTDANAVLYGVGAARYGQESQLIPEFRNLMESMTESLFSTSVNIGETSLVFFDSGLTKIIIEFGIGGIVIWVLPIVFVMRVILPVVFRNNRVALDFGLAYMILAYMVFFLKAHSVLSDLFLSSLFYLLLGGFAYALKRRAENSRNTRWRGGNFRPPSGTISGSTE